VAQVAQVAQSQSRNGSGIPLRQWRSRSMRTWSSKTTGKPRTPSTPHWRD